MDSGASSALACWRCDDGGTGSGICATTLAVAGRSSDWRAYGSAFSGSNSPERDRISNL